MAASESGREKAARGASATTISWREVFTAWCSHHGQSARESLARQRRAPLQHLLTALVIGITLALPALFGLAIENLRQLNQHWDGAPRASLFLSRTVTSGEIAALQQAVQRQAGIAVVELITPEQGLAEFEQVAGLSGTLTLLDENPLPPVLAVTLDSTLSAQDVAQRVATWSAMAGVEQVQADVEWVRKLHHLMQLGQRITIALATLLGLGALLSVGNTIRLAIENRRTEIVVAKLVGATDAFVRRPFLYSGFWFGLSGGIVAVLFVLAGYHAVDGPVRELAALYQSGFQLQGPGLAEVAGLLFVGVGLGVLGAWLAVGQHLHDMRPR